jgi:phage-related protein (TIGR01555 family)
MSIQDVKQFRSDSRFLMQLFSSIAAEKFNTTDVSVDSYTPKFNKTELSSLVRKNGVLRRAVYDFPQSAAASWIKLNYSKETNKSPEEVLDYLMKIPYYTHAKPSIEGYGMRNAFKYASGLARKFGSAYIVLGVADGRDLSEPINTKRIQTIDWLKVYDCYQLTYNFTGVDVDIPGTLPTNQDFYRLPNSTMLVHPDRVLSFYGNFLDTREEFYDSQYYHDSIVTSLFEAFSNWLVGNKAIAKLLVKSTAYKFAMQDLGELVRQDIDSESTKNQDYLKTRAASLNNGLTVADILWYDKEFEELDTVALNLSGVKDSIDSLKDNFAAVSDMPRWKLFNEFGSSSLAASVQASQMIRYQWAYSTIDWASNNWLDPLQKVIKLCMSAKDLYGTVLDNFSENSIEFPINIKLTLSEQLEIEKLAAERSKILLEQGVLTAEEVRSQYSSSQFNPNITLDANSWNELQKEKEEQKQLMNESMNTQRTEEPVNTKKRGRPKKAVEE